MAETNKIFTTYLFSLATGFSFAFVQNYNYQIEIGGMLGNVLNGIQNWPSDADFFGPSDISTTLGPPKTTAPTCKDKKKNLK